MIKVLQDLIDSAQFWPEEDQEALAAAAQEIEARRIGVYVITEDERTAVSEGLAEARRGEFIPDGEIAKFWQHLGV